MARHLGGRAAEAGVKSDFAGFLVQIYSTKKADGFCTGAAYPGMDASQGDPVDHAILEHMRIRP